MAVKVESTAAPWRDGWQRGIVPFALSIPSLIRGIDRINDGHPLSGWLMAVSGALMAATGVALYVRSRG
jgi:hypothetical protein